MIERICSTFGGIESFPTSASSPETHKRCVSIVLRKVLSARDGKSLNHYHNSKSHHHFMRYLLRYFFIVHFKVFSRDSVLYGFSKGQPSLLQSIAD